MYEVEVKVRADHESVGRRLEELGAEPLDAVEQVDTYYGHPVRDFAETDEALRIRRERRHGEIRPRITYKGPLVEAESKTREEFETGLDDAETMTRILERLGFEAVESVEKTRQRFRVDGYTVTLDAVDGLGEFLEVETEAGAETVEPAREGAFELLERLDLDPDQQVRTSYLGLLLEGDP